MSFLDHIEFVKGPAGFMLANGDPSGLYNVVTKKPTGQTKGEVAMTVGNYGLYRTTLDLDGKLSKDGKFLYRLNVAGQNKKPFRANEFNNRYSIAPVVSYQINEKMKLTAEYTLQYAKMSDVGSYYVFSPDGYASLPRSFTTLPAGIEPTKIKDHSLLINLQHQFNSDWKLTTQVAYLNYKQKGTSLWPTVVNSDGTMIRNVSIWDAKSKMTLAQVFLNGNVTTGIITHKILGGIDVGSKDYMADWNQYHDLDTLGAEFDIYAPSYGAPVNGYPVWDRTTNLKTRATDGGGLINQKYAGLYVQDELGFLNNRVRLTLAGRYTYVKQATWGDPAVSAKHFTPRVGLSVSVNKQTSFYALYDQAFLPQAGKLADGGSIKPLTGNNKEVGIKRDWADGRWNTTISVYNITKRNELTSDPNSPPNSGLSIVLGEKRAQGVEFDLRGRIVNGLNLVANYAYTDSRVTKVAEGVTDIKVNDVVSGFSKHTINTWLSYKLQSGALKGTGISGGFTYLAHRATQNWSNNANENLPNYFKLDGGLFWEKEKIRVTFNVFNILDKYLYSGSFYGFMGNIYSWQAKAPRNVRLSVSYKF